MGENTLHLDGTIGDREDEPVDIQAAVEDGVSAVLDGEEPDTSLEGQERGGEEGGEQTPDTGSEAASEQPRDEGDTGDEGAPEGVAAGESGKNTGAEAPDYSVPEGLNERSTERFTALVEDNKAQRELVSQQSETLNGMRAMVTNSGLTNEEFVGAIDFASTVKRNPQQGIKMMQGYIKHIAKVAGIKPEGMELDLLDDFPDLREKVEDMEISEEAALELAHSRRRAKAEQQQRTENTSRQAAAAQYKTAQDSALMELGTYLSAVSKNDIDWEAKAPLVLDAAKYARENIHPSKWVAYMKNEYNRINKIASSVGNKRSETPLTGGNHPRGGQKEPKTIEEALDQLL